MLNGVINLNKPTGMTSHDMVALVRRLLGTKRVGHTGTLDPNASGVLPICVGMGTRAADLLSAADKEYRAVLRLGITTDTEDMTGTVLSESTPAVSEAEIRSVFDSFLGSYAQLPPMYSAIKKNGKKLYELARKGITVERTPRTVTLHELEILSILEAEVTFRVKCSKGTYIRTLCKDIGERLECGGCMQSLCRTACGDLFSIQNSITPDELKKAAEQNRISEYVTPLDSFFSDYPRLDLNEIQSARVKNGVPIYFDGDVDSVFRVYDAGGQFIALSEIVAGEERTQLKMKKGFYTNEDTN